MSVGTALLAAAILVVALVFFLAVVIWYERGWPR